MKSPQPEATLLPTPETFTLLLWCQLTVFLFIQKGHHLHLHVSLNMLCFCADQGLIMTVHDGWELLIGPLASLFLRHLAGHLNDTAAPVWQHDTFLCCFYFLCYSWPYWLCRIRFQEHAEPLTASSSSLEMRIHLQALIQYLELIETRDTGGHKHISLLFLDIQFVLTEITPTAFPPWQHQCCMHVLLKCKMVSTISSCF